MVEPDLIVNCDRDRIRRNGLYGAPDLVIEILSPSTRQKDSIIKTRKYEAAGVREYWIIDPEQHSVAVYYFQNGHFPTFYGFNDKIPVRIRDGKMEIDFAEIYRQVSYLEELRNF